MNLKLSQSGDPLNELDELAPGVLGYAIQHTDGSIYIPLIEAKLPGNGDVSRFLDSLEKTTTWKFPTVVSPRLEEMLKRRGFVLQSEYDKEFGFVPVWVLEKKS